VPSRVDCGTLAYLPSQCPVCFENVCRTVILPCGHGICEADLGKIGLEICTVCTEEGVPAGSNPEHSVSIISQFFEYLAIGLLFLCSLIVVVQRWLREFMTQCGLVLQRFPRSTTLPRSPPSLTSLHSDLQHRGACVCASNDQSTHCLYVFPDWFLAEVCSCGDRENHWGVTKYSAAGLHLQGSIVLLSHQDGKDLFWVGSDSKLHHLHQGECSPWQHTHHDVPAICSETKLIAGRSDDRMKVFWSGIDGNVHEFHKGSYNDWQWQHGVHSAPGLPRNYQASLAIVSHNDVFNLFWVGSDCKLHELHHGQHNGWRWHHTMHDAPAMFQESRLIAGRNDYSLRVFWSGRDGQRLHELHMGDHNDWQWQRSVHRAPGLPRDPTTSAAIACHKDVFNLFWVGSDSKLHELHHGQHNSWRWQHARHDVPSMSPQTSLALSRNSNQFGVFWFGYDSKIHIMHKGTEVGWRWKHLALSP